MENVKYTEGMNFYIVRIKGNMEKSIAERLKKEAESGELVGKVGQVIVPLEKIIYLKDGKKVQKDKILLPGYIFMETNSLGELKYFLKSIKGVAGFLTERNGDIKSLSEADVNRMVGKNTDSVKESSFMFTIGEEVMINEGPFSSMKATIEKIEDQKVILAVSIFGRKTPLTLESNQIDKMHA